ncbi:MAG: hypothetical protein FRX49_09161 [Trebouxia sp. A1-2]|nr:MAG: hypothetical protein FRX49_09161 [Trebouxia sp. A1-2]
MGDPSSWWWEGRGYCSLARPQLQQLQAHQPQAAPQQAWQQLRSSSSCRLDAGLLGPGSELFPERSCPELKLVLQQQQAEDQPVRLPELGQQQNVQQFHLWLDWVHGGAMVTQPELWWGAQGLHRGGKCGGAKGSICQASEEDFEKSRPKKTGLGAAHSGGCQECQHGFRWAVGPPWQHPVLPQLPFELDELPHSQIGQQQAVVRLSVEQDKQYPGPDYMDCIRLRKRS